MPDTTATTVTETERDLIATAQAALSHCNFTVGECAAKWCQRYARGRTDADFGALVGLSGEQIYQRRRVWESFADVVSDYGSLKWSHFYVSLAWDDSAECLAWADENQASVAEMKAWRRMQHGESLDETSTEDGVTEDGFDPAGSAVTDDAEPALAANLPTAEPRETFAAMDDTDEQHISLPTDGPSARDEAPTIDTTALVSKASTAIERVCRMLHGIDLADVPAKDITRLAIAIGNLNNVQESQNIYARD